MEEIMRRKLAIALLALGTIGGYASGFAALRCNAASRRAAFQQHVAALCVNAAREADAASAERAAPARRMAPDTDAP
jgi:hypothetical protein